MKIESLKVISSLTGYHAFLRTEYQKDGKTFIRRQSSKSFPTYDLAKDWILQNQDSIKTSQDPQITFDQLIKSIKDYDRFEFKPVIVKFYDRHEDRYFTVYNNQDLSKVCLKIFKERDSYDEFLWIERESEKELTEPSFNKDKIQDLPTELQDSAKQSWSDYERKLKDLNHYKRLASLLKEARTGDLTSAKIFFDEMEGYEIIESEEY